MPRGSIARPWGDHRQGPVFPGPVSRPSKGPRVLSILRFAAPLALAAALAGCSRSGELDLTSGVGVTAIRTACPVVGLPSGTVYVTLFDPPARRDSAAFDVVATLSNRVGACAFVGQDGSSTLMF